jgi:hypothetical protein
MLSRFLGSSVTESGPGQGRYFVPPIGQSLGPPHDASRYEIVGRLGVGGFSGVWLARDIRPAHFSAALKPFVLTCVFKGALVLSELSRF